MSDPSEQGGRPLASTISHTEGNTQSTFHQPRRQRKDSASSDERTQGTKSTPSRRRPGTRKEGSSGPHVGSSRGARSTMQRSTSPSLVSPDMKPISYTRTGRVSKAKKGLKVHDCECGKSYTRAEHLRRHKKNHASETLICEYPDCGKTFYRLDLLQRHQERHGETGKDSQLDSYFSPQPSAEVEDQTTAVPQPPTIITALTPHHEYFSPVVASPIPETTPDPRYTPDTFRTPNLPSSSFNSRPFPRSSPNFNFSFNVNKAARFSPHLHGQPMPIQVEGLQGNPFHDPFSVSPSSGHASPYPNADYPYFSSSQASFNDTRWVIPSRSPISATSTGTYTWGSEARPVTHIPYVNPGYPMPGMTIPPALHSMSGYGPSYGPKLMAQRDEEEQSYLFPDQSFGMEQFADSSPFGQYLDTYWRLFHPSFPVVHRASFERMMAQSPMLRAAMIAIGMQYSNDPSAKRKSRILHDRCLKLLRQRDQETMCEEERLCDLQSLFLVELLSQYRARRAAKKLSSRFESLYFKVLANFRASTTNMMNELPMLAQPAHATNERWMQWIGLASQQRLLQCCFVLEYQQASLLARSSPSPTDSISGMDLPFPVHSAMWDAADFPEWAIACQQYPYMPALVQDVNSDFGASLFDPFQSSVLIAVHYNQANNSVSYITPPPDSIDHLLDPSILTQHRLFTAKLVQLTPVRSLLAVAGESWILSEKIPTPHAFNNHKASVRSWAEGLWVPAEPQIFPAKEALKLAIDILQQATATPSDQLRLELGADMGLYFATLVVWSITAIAHSRMVGPQPSRSHPMPHQTPSPLPYDGFSGGLMPATPTHLSATSSRTSQSPNPMHPSTTGLIPTSHSSPIVPTSHGMMFSEINATTEEFLSNAKVELEYLGLVPIWPRDVMQWQHGCSALLRWVKMRLRSGAFDARDSVVGAGPTSASTGHGGDGQGELLDGVINVLDKMISHGWEGWGI
ncbi:hypothetical protein BU24DRAFT_436201 [Aaosphaeria arxii CBS 175.79]|uniref:C2H2-type domain-containing protein n=1 Tax=Aaosphaeria arxii CBS 175.79 TaxID=1450172 RepID=A0A6A5XD98_9PLEO|nr:uncharacterized protein BU24DRAFT_436201 [Aaosphaeria arxii CBS 175.79]KAF2010777.1 hypothetical protein BU24DRAFT_436201 [Aaosphaeria arxii CBS 175.79]